MLKINDRKTALKLVIKTVILALFFYTIIINPQQLEIRLLILIIFILAIFFL